MQSQIRKVFARQLRAPQRQTSLLQGPMRMQPFSQSNYSTNENTSRKMQMGLLLAGAAGVSYMTKDSWAPSFKKQAFAESNTKDFEISFADELGEGEMRDLKVGPKDDDKVLIVKYQGKIHSVGNYCTHFGAPMSTGVLVDDKVMCPWHTAGFSIVTGAHESGPALDSLPTYEVLEKNGKHFVKLPETLPKRATPPMAKRDPKNKTKYVIVGGGAAGLTCAETLRQSNFTGEITIISAEQLLPYDRTLLSKVLPTGDPTKTLLRPQEFLDQYNIDIKLASKAEKVDTKNKTITLGNGEKISYDKLCIATGGEPRRPKIAGIDLANVFLLRNSKDQQEIKEKAAHAKSVAIIGSGFIGSEAAAALKGKYKEDLKVHLIGMEQYPLQRVLGEEIAEMIKNEHEKHGVSLHMGATLKEIKGDKTVKSIVLGDGTEIEADMVIVGAGINPATGITQGTDIQTDKFGGLICDPFLQTSSPDVYAAGDIVSFPYWPTGERVRVEHWVVAQDQGSYAAFNMLGKHVPYGKIPFFWTRHYNKAIQSIGYAPSVDEIIIQGSVPEQKFLAFYTKGNKVLAITGMANNKNMLYLWEAMAQNQMPAASDIKSGKESVDSIINRVKQNKGAGKCMRENCCQKKGAVQPAK